MVPYAIQTMASYESLGTDDRYRKHREVGVRSLAVTLVSIYRMGTS